MTLNLPRVFMRDAVSVMQGLKAARGREMPFVMFDAIAMSEEEAELLQDDAMFRRAVDEAKREAME